MPLVAMCMTFAACNKAPRWQHQQGAVWNTTFNIVYESDKDLTDSVFAVFAEIEGGLSIFTDGSIVNSVNAGDTVEVNQDFINVFETACSVSRASGGKYDPTVAPLVELWGFGRNKDITSEPTAAEIEEALKAVGINECIIINGVIVKKDRSTQFNFSSIAKGYGCDKVAAMLCRNGVNNYLVEIGGEIALKGQSHRNKDWVVQIDAPVAEKKDEHVGMAVIEVSDCGVATSGNYRNYRVDANGNRIAHTIDATTGYPAVTPTLAATVIAPDVMTADALATALMAMQPDDAMIMIEMMPDVEALLVIDSGSGGFEAKKEWETIDGSTQWIVVTSPGFPKIKF